MSKELICKKMCMVKDIGRNDNLFGGNMLSWLDEAASVYAYTYTREPRMVTLRMGEIVFHRPARLGDIIEIYCSNPRQGTTSFTFDISVECRGEEILATDCTFVAIDEHGQKKPIGMS